MQQTGEEIIVLEPYQLGRGYSNNIACFLKTVSKEGKPITDKDARAHIYNITIR
jgi:hypothetical protein